MITSVKLCGICQKMYKPKDGIKMIKVNTQVDCDFSNPKMSNLKLEDLIEVRRD